MLFSKRFRFHDKVFKAEDVKAIWKYISSLKDSDAKNTASIIIRNEGEDVSAEDDSVFNSLNFLRKDIKEIEIKYWDADYKSRISLLIADVESFSCSYANRVEVESPNEQWVEFNVAKLHDIIDLVDSTSLIGRILRKFFFVGHLLSCFIMFDFYMDFVIPWIKGLNCNQNFRFVLAVLIFLIGVGVLCMIWHLNARSKIVAIDINGLQSKRNRNMLSVCWSIIGGIVIPILIAWYFASDKNKTDKKHQENDKGITTNVMKK